MAKRNAKPEVRNAARQAAITKAKEEKRAKEQTKATRVSPAHIPLHRTVSDCSLSFSPRVPLSLPAPPSRPSRPEARLVDKLVADKFAPLDSLFSCRNVTDGLTRGG